MHSHHRLAAAVLGTLLVTSLPAQTQLIGHFTFDDPANLGADSSGFGNNADTIYNVTATTAGQFGHAANFDGSYLRWTSSTNPVQSILANDFTFSVWLKTTQSFASDGSSGNDGAGIIWGDLEFSNNDAIPMALTGNNLGFFTGSPSGDTTIHSTTAINTGDYVFLAVTRDLVTGQNLLYVNGALEASSITGPGVPLNASGELVVGGNLLDDRYFTGTLDDLRIYDGVLSSTAIGALYSGASAVPEPSSCAALLGFAGLGFAAAKRRRSPAVAAATTSDPR